MCYNHMGLHDLLLGYLYFLLNFILQETLREYYFLSKIDLPQKRERERERIANMWRETVVYNFVWNVSQYSERVMK
jgi:hypothetical protein